MLINLLFLNLFPTIGLCSPAISDNIISCGQDLQCILKELVFTIPDQNFSFTVDNSTFPISTQGVEVYDIDLDHFNISYFPDTNRRSDDIILKLQINSANVKGNLKIGLPLSLTGSITNFSVSLPLHFARDGYNLLDNATIDNDTCSIHMGNLNIKLPFPMSIIMKPYLNPLIEEGLNFLNSKLCELLGPVILNTSSNLFSKINQRIIPELSGPTSLSIPITDLTKLLPMKNSSFINLIQFILNSYVANDDTPLSINNLINRFIGVADKLNLLEILHDLANISIPIDIPIPVPQSETKIDFIINEISISGIDTWYNCSFLLNDPINPMKLNSHAGLGNLGIDIYTSFNFTAVNNITNQVSTYSQEFNLSTVLNNTTLDFNVQLAPEKDATSTYTDAQCINLQCLLNLLQGNETGINTIQFNTIVDKFVYNTEGVLDNFLFNVIVFLFDFIVSNNIEKVPDFLNGYLLDAINTTINPKIQNSINNNSCHYIPNTPFNQVEYSSTFGSLGAAIGLAIVIVIISLVFKRKVRRYQECEVQIGKNAVEDRKGKSSAWISFWRSDDKASLMMHPSIPLWSRMIIPFLLLSNIALFVSSNTGLGAGVFLKLLIGGRLISFPSMFDFGLINSIVEMWKAKTYFLSILIAVFSCAWPYTKLILMLIVFMLPATCLKVHIRSRILRILDVLGKWSLLDSYVMVLMLIAFNITLTFPVYGDDTSIQPTVLNVWVFPAWGFIALILGTLMSLALSHIICGMNRIAKNHNKDEKNSEVITAVYQNNHWIINFILVVMLGLAIASFTIGIISPSTQFDFVGLAGWAIDLLHEKTSQQYTVVGLASQIPKAAQHPKSFSVRFTQIVFYIVTIIMPYVHMISLFVLLFWPLPKRKLTKLYHVCEIFSAWASVDVFLISIVAAVLEIGQLALFLVADKCDPINPIIQKYFSQENYVQGHEKCFEIETKILSGIYFLLIAVVFHTTATIWIGISARKITKEEQTSSGKEAGKEVREASTNIDDEREPEIELTSLDPYEQRRESAKIRRISSNLGIKNMKSVALSDVNLRVDLVNDGTFAEINKRNKRTQSNLAQTDS